MDRKRRGNPCWIVTLDRSRGARRRNRAAELSVFGIHSDAAGGARALAGDESRSVIGAGRDTPGLKVTMNLVRNYN
jgi:hypothetical protein